MKTFTNFAGLLEGFFTDRLMRQRRVSSHTIVSYRDTFRLLLKFAQQRLKKEPSELSIEYLDAPFIGAFLDYLEKDRNNSIRSRNLRLAAIHSFFRYAALHDPTHIGLIQRVLAIPTKRYERTSIEFLTPHEINSLLAAPDQSSWTGRRDRALLLVAVQTGLRVSELINLRCEDVILNNGAHVRCQGKGRKERCIPLRKEAVTVLRSWLHEHNHNSSDFLFPNRRGSSLSRDGIEYILKKYIGVAQQQCPSLKNKRVSPHVLRHTMAMDLLQHGVDHAVIALWLGHESPETTQIYLHASLQLKEQILTKITPANVKIERYRPENDQLLAFLKGL